MEKAEKKSECYQQVLLTAGDAVMAVAILAVAADGKLDAQERSDLQSLLAANQVFGKVRDAKKYMNRVSSTVAGKGRDATLIEATGLLSPCQRETAYAWAVYMIAADRKTVSPEHKFLSLLRRRFAIHGALAGKINAVVPMLRRAR